MGDNPDFWGEMIKPLLIAGGFMLAAVGLGVALVIVGGWQ
jgi:hypothetical protein